MEIEVNNSNNQELQIVQALSTVKVPEKVLKSSNIQGLIDEIDSKKDAVKSNAERLDGLRKDKEKNNFFMNWWDDRDDHIQDAQLKLSTSIGYLTKHSSDLLIVNTAISKVLIDQQQILLRQQDLLEQQANGLAEQNQKILDQQKLLEQLPEQIKTAIEAAGSTIVGPTMERVQRLEVALKNTDAQMLVFQEALQKSEKYNRAALIAVACVALASLGWQITQHLF